MVVFAISEAKIDSRLKAIATVSMYDMGTATRSALGHSQKRRAEKKKLSKKRLISVIVSFLGAKNAKYTSGTADKIE